MKTFLSRGKAALVMVAAGAATVVSVAVASANALHLRLVRSEPAADSSVAVQPAAIKLWFSEVVKPATTALRLTGSDNVAIPLDTLTAGKTVSEPVTARTKGSMKPGKYKLAWRTMGSDGHVLNGEFSFTLKAAVESPDKR